MSSWQCSGEFREADQLGEGGGEALFPLLGPHPDWSQVSGTGGEELGGSQAGACAAWREWAGGGELAPPWEEGRGSLGSENCISGAHFTAKCVAFGDKGTVMFWGVLREVDKEN